MSKSLIGEGVSPAEEMLLSFGRTAAETEPDTASEKPKPAPKKKATPKKPAKETRDIHVSLVLTPSMADQLKERAWKKRTSVNKLVEEIIADYLNK